MSDEVPKQATEPAPPVLFDVAVAMPGDGGDELEIHRGVFAVDFGQPTALVLEWKHGPGAPRITAVPWRDINRVTVHRAEDDNLARDGHGFRALVPDAWQCQECGRPHWHRIHDNYPPLPLDALSGVVSYNGIPST